MSSFFSPTKEEYYLRRTKVRATLTKFGVSQRLIKKINCCYPVGMLEKLIQSVERRHPENPADYFLKGLTRSKIKHGRILIKDEDERRGMRG
jgi:hypothetical protein